MPRKKQVPVNVLSEEMDMATIARELIRCKKDAAYFICNYIYIQHPIRGIIRFDMYEFQKKVLKQFFDNRYNIILKARQLGISTLVSAYALWLAIFHSNKSILVLATKEDVAKNIIAKVNVMIRRLPLWMAPKVVEDNKLEKRFSNESFIKAIATTEESGRSEALSLLIVDEAAFIAGMDKIWAAAYHTLQTGGDCIVLSTPNGVGNWYHKTFIEAQAGLNRFNPIILHWSVHPDHDDEWRREQDKNDPKLAAQECDVNFLTSGDNVIDPTLIQEHYVPMIKKPLTVEWEDRNLHIWEYPSLDPGVDYVIAGDVATGDGSDYSSAIVLRVSPESIDSPDTIVATYKGKIATDRYGDMMNQLAKNYHNALLVIENNAYGHAPLQKLLELGYPNLYYTPKGSAWTYDFVNTYKDLEEIKYDGKPGFTTSLRTRPALITKLIHVFTNRFVILHDQRILDELSTFVWQNGKAQAREGYNDDLVMAMAIALWVRDVAYKIKAIQTQQLSARIDAHSWSSQSLPIFVSSKGSLPDPYKMITPIGTEENLNWLLDD